MKTSPLEEDTDETTAKKVKYHFYDTVETTNSYGGNSKHIKLATATLPIGQFMKLYREKLSYYTYHRGMVRLTTAIRLERMGISPGDAQLIMDYSEKLNKERKTISTAKTKATPAQAKQSPATPHRSQAPAYHAGGDGGQSKTREKYVG